MTKPYAIGALVTILGTLAAACASTAVEERDSLTSNVVIETPACVESACAEGSHCAADDRCYPDDCTPSIAASAAPGSCGKGWRCISQGTGASAQFVCVEGAPPPEEDTPPPPPANKPDCDAVPEELACGACAAPSLAAVMPCEYPRTVCDYALGRCVPR